MATIGRSIPNPDRKRPATTDETKKLNEVRIVEKYQRVNVDQICIQERVREELGDLETLKNSLRDYGLLNPILVDAQLNLIAGERRLRAIQALGWAEVDVRILDGLTPIACFDIEVHENLLRKEFTDKEIAKSIETKKRLLNPPWYVRCLNWMRRIKQRLAPVRHRPVRPPASDQQAS